MKKICMVTSTRADWGLLTPLAAALRDRDDVELRIVATNMHLIERYGMTVNEIVSAGFDVAARVDMQVDGDDEASRAHSMARCLDGMADVFKRYAPDMLILLGDRYEMLAVAGAALVMRIPIVHIAGGAISEGAVDDAVRHALTKMSSLHLVETEENRHRVIQMGEQPERVINTGAVGVWNIMHQPLLSQEQLEQSLDGFHLDANSSLLVTYHPATLDNEDPAVRFDQLLQALDKFPHSQVLITFPNNDAGGDKIVERILAYASANPERVKAVKSLGMLRYLSALRCVAAVVGNSSSGIVEVPSMHIPTVNIGIRQNGRLCSDSVIHCGDSADDIARAISYALSDEGEQRARAAENPYYRDDTVRLMVDAIMNFDTHNGAQKKFYDIK
jgi:UDP-N-acetylglucosamine 2-epimerase (non-hydrolysing)/GDP/UDP-N,N'-diacetylbacillosamine 2-epimerase (hydrolysing)